VGEMGGPCSTYERGEKCVQNYSREAYEKDHLEDIDVDGRIVSLT